MDDVKFLSALIDELKDKYKIDHTRVYATGMSNGGFMSGRLACELADKIAAVAIVGASLSEEEAGDCHPVQPVSVLIVQGTADPVVPFAGGPLGDAGARGVVLSHDEAVRRFVAADHCAENTKTEHIPDLAGDGTNIDVTMYGPCADGSEVRGCDAPDGTALFEAAEDLDPGVDGELAGLRRGGRSRRCARCGRPVRAAPARTWSSSRMMSVPSCWGVVTARTAASTLGRPARRARHTARADATTTVLGSRGMRVLE